MKRISMILAAVCLLLCLSLPAAAENLPIIHDDADLLTAEEEAKLYEDMLPICEYGTPMFWSTTQSGDFEQLAEDYYHRQIGTASGTLFVINMKVRQLTVFSDGAIYRVVTNAEAETITDNVYRLAGSGKYYDCASGAFDQVARLLRGDRIARPMKIVSNIFLAATLSLMVVYLYISRRYEQNKPAGRVKTAIPASVLSTAAFTLAVNHTAKQMIKRVKTDLSDSGGSGGGRMGGGGFGGGGGGGGHSGGGGSHGF